MADPAQLEKRIAELEREVRVLRGRRAAGIRHRSAAAIGDLPLLSIAIGPDLAEGEIRGHARGVIAIGDFATGVIAVGGLARGAVAVGGLAIHPEAPDNLAYDWAYGDEAEVDGIFKRAAHVTRLELVDNRVMANPMEPRGCFAEWTGGRLHLGYSGHAKALEASEERLHAENPKLATEMSDAALAVKAAEVEAGYVLGIAVGLRLAGGAR